MAYDWEKELKEEYVFLSFVALFPCAAIIIGTIIGILNTSMPLIFDIIISAFFAIACIFFIWLPFSIRLSEIDPDAYAELKNMADKLEKNGYLELKEEIKKLMGTKGKIKRYQYLTLTEDYEGLKKDLDLQKARQSLA